MVLVQNVCAKSFNLEETVPKKENLEEIILWHLVHLDSKLYPNF